MKEKVLNVGLLGATWVLGLVLPHFQPDPNIFELLFDSAVVLLLTYSLWCVLRNIFLNSKQVSYGLTSALVLLFLTSYLLLRLGSPTLYDLWSRLGSGSMEIEGDLFPFGDLVHFTAAAGCVTGIEIGVNSCDPWQRAFNQNPDVSRFLDFIGLTNVNLLGISSYLMLTTLLILNVRKQNLSNIAFIIFIASPPFVLAVDRGNEIITIFLILLGLNLLESKNKYLKSSSVIFLLAAVIFKLWPLLLIGSLAIFASKPKQKYLLIAFALSAGYWLSSLNEIPKMFSATQSGSPHGVAFGFKLFFSEQTSPINAGYLALMAILIAGLWIKYFGSSINAAFAASIRDPRFEILVPTLLTYVGIWIFTDSFIYRMLILLPALLILISPDLLSHFWVKGLLVLILVSVLSSRLAITTGVSSSLALVSLFVSILYARARIQNYISQRQTSEEGIAESR
jgi:hypothetical protein